MLTTDQCNRFAALLEQCRREIAFAERCIESPSKTLPTLVRLIAVVTGTQQALCATTRAAATKQLVTLQSREKALLAILDAA